MNKNVLSILSALMISFCGYTQDSLTTDINLPEFTFSVNAHKQIGELSTFKKKNVFSRSNKAIFSNTKFSTIINYCHPATIKMVNPYQDNEIILEELQIAGSEIDTNDLKISMLVIRGNQEVDTYALRFEKFKNKINYFFTYEQKYFPLDTFYLTILIEFKNTNYKEFEFITNNSINTFFYNASKMIINKEPQREGGWSALQLKLIYRKLN